MKPPLIFWTVGLIAAIGLFACAPAATPVPATEIAAPMLASATPTDLSAPEATAQPAEVQAIATSRGPNLEATDPATVNLASGQLQLIEFFRFT